MATVFLLLPLDERLKLRCVSKAWQRSAETPVLWYDVDFRVLGRAAEVPPLLCWVVDSFGGVVQRVCARQCQLSPAALAVLGKCRRLQALELSEFPGRPTWVWDMWKQHYVSSLLSPSGGAGGGALTIGGRGRALSSPRPSISDEDSAGLSPVAGSGSSSSPSSSTSSSTNVPPVSVDSSAATGSGSGSGSGAGSASSSDALSSALSSAGPSSGSSASRPSVFPSAVLRSLVEHTRAPTQPPLAPYPHRAFQLNSSITDASLQSVLTCSSLTALDVAGCRMLTDDGLRAIVAGAGPRLEVLRAGSQHFTRAGFEALAKGCPRLRRLELNYTLAQDSLLVTLSRHCTRLEALYLDNTREVTDAGLFALVSTCKQLHELVLFNCCRITDESMLLMSQSLRKLRVLELSWNPHITDVGIDEILHCCSALHTLTVAHFTHVTESILATALTLPNLLHLTIPGIAMGGYVEALHSVCHSLASIDLSNSGEVPDSVLTDLAHLSTNIKRLSLRRCRLEGFFNLAFAVLWTKLRLLQVLDVSHTDVCDETLCFLPYRHPPLQAVNLAFCPGISDEGVFRLAVGAGKNLRQLVLNSCPAVGDHGLAYLSHHCPFLEVLDVRGCTHVTDKGLAEVGSHLEFLTDLAIGTAEQPEAQPFPLRAWTKGGGRRGGGGGGGGGSGGGKGDRAGSGSGTGAGAGGAGGAGGASDASGESKESSPEVVVLKVEYTPRTGFAGWPGFYAEDGRFWDGDPPPSSIITNKGLQAVARLPRLKWLEVDGCDRISTKGVAALASGSCGPRLTHLTFRRCPTLNDDSVAALAGCPALTSLHFHGCAHVSQSALDRLASSRESVALDVALK